MRSVILQFSLVLLCAGAPLDGMAQAPGASACGHYDNRARFLPRSGAVSFPAILAEACAGAAATLADPLAPEGRRAAASAFLLRLDAARRTMAEIDQARFAKARATKRDSGAGAAVRDFRREHGMITESGEFLILREAGVFALLGAWVAQGADFSLIAALPPALARR